MTVEIPGGVEEVLEVRSSDDFEMVADEFCEHHKLDAEARQLIVTTIRQNLFGTELATIESQIKEEESDSEQSLKEQISSFNKTEKASAVWKETMRPLEKGKKTCYPIINENSKRIVERKGLAKISIYERLQPAYKQPKRSTDGLSTKPKSHQNTLTKRLHKELSQINERRQYFKPKINSKSRLIVICSYKCRPVRVQRGVGAMC